MSKIFGVHIPNGTKNYVINGDMRISQRATTFTNPTNAYTLDRWLYGGTTALGNVTQDTDVPTLAQSGYLFQNSWKLAITTPDTSIAAGDQYTVSQRIEGYVFANFAQKIFTVSFWIKAPVTGIYSISFGNNGGDRDYTAEYTILAANTWEYKTITVVASPGSGSFLYNNGIGLIFRFCFAAGSNFFLAPGAWGTGNRLCSSNQVNGVGVSGNILLTGVMINEGSLAFPFRLFGEGIEAELAACQRYYEAQSSHTLMMVGTAAPTNTYIASTQFYKVSKRATPSLSIVDGVGNANKVTGRMPNSSTVDNLTHAGLVADGTDALHCHLDGQSTYAGIDYRFFADAEL